MVKKLSALLLALIMTACGCSAKESYTERTLSDALANGWELILINDSNGIPDGFHVETVTLRYGYLVDERILPDLQQMFDDARAQEIYPLVVSGYRTVEQQEKLYREKIDGYVSLGLSEEEATKEASGWAARPGYSEHHTGLAIDVGAESGSVEEVYGWLEENGWKYGFILRYPPGKGNITGINYEPWHFRYVGKDAAEYIYANGITLEEYLSVKIEA